MLSTGNVKPFQEGLRRFTAKGLYSENREIGETKIHRFGHAKLPFNEVRV